MPKLSLLMIVLVFSAVVWAGAKEPAASPAAATPEKSYEQLVQDRLREGFDAIARSPCQRAGKYGQSRAG